jgi:hypothetical protein
MNAHHKPGTAKRSKRSLAFGWLPSLLLLVVFASGAAPAVPGEISAGNVLASLAASVRGAVEASTEIVQDVYQLYQITRLRDARAASEMAPAAAPATISPAELKFCKAKAALPAVDKSRS